MKELPQQTSQKFQADPVESYDFVIVGAGTAGCVLADRLTDSGQHRVLLLEAGGSDRRLDVHVPLLVAKLLNNKEVTWPFRSEPQVHLNGAPQLLVRGKLLGGSSSINGNVFVRGDPAEYDDWARSGCLGWSYSDLLPYFKRLESFPRGSAAVRGRDGPISVTELENFDELSQAFLASCAQAGIPPVMDYNDGSYAGSAYLQYSTRRGFRCSTARAYLSRARRRKNLRVLTGALALRILIDQGRATGVAYRLGDVTHRALTTGEVILSAGPMLSPTLLELSGIGNGKLLSGVGIEVVRDLPAVGENLRDHPNTRVAFACAKPLTINDVLKSPLRQFVEALKFIAYGGGMLSICSATAQAILHSGVHPTKADLKLQLHPLSGSNRYARTPKEGLDGFSGFTIGITALQARSRGTVHITSADPLEPPRINPDYLAHPDDLATLYKGLNEARRIAALEPLRKLVKSEIRPGPDVTSEDDLVAYIRNTTQTTWHFVGSCRMGADAESVVDPQLRVRGIERLRIVDSSIFPTIPSSNTNAPTIAAAEKAADMIRQAQLA